MASGSKQSVLDHPTRRDVYEYLLLMPGAHLRSVSRFLRLPLGTANYHLNILLSERLVRSVPDDGRRRFYPTGQKSRPELNRLYEQHWEYRDLRVRILATAKRLGKASPAKVARELGISRQRAAYHLARLRDAGLVSR